MKMFWKPRSRINGFPLVVVGVRGADGRLRTSPTLVEGVIPHHIGFRITYVFVHKLVHSCIWLLCANKTCLCGTGLGYTSLSM